MTAPFCITDEKTGLAILANYGPSAFAAYWVLLIHMNRSTRRSRPSQPTICMEANISESTCKRALHDLETGGYIDREGGRGRGNFTEYLIKGFGENPLPDGKGFTKKGPQKGSHSQEKGPSGTPSDDKRVHENPEKGSRQDLKGFTADPPLTLMNQSLNQSIEPESVGAQAPKTEMARPTRLPQDWVIPDEWKIHPDTVKAISMRPWVDIAVEETLFRNYWTARVRDATKLDWFRTWINWLYNTKPPHGWRPAHPTGPSNSKSGGLQARAAEIQKRLDARERDREAERCKSQ